MPFLVPLEAKPSPFGGNGLFAKADIAAGTKIWVMKPKGDDVAKVVPLEQNVPEGEKQELTENDVWTEEKMTGLPADQIERIFWGGYAHEPSATWIELRDGGNYTNHSSEKWNCMSEFTDSPWDEEHFCVKGAKAGDEILDDYGGFHNAKVPWINALMEKACPGRHDFERDFATPNKPTM
mmetsp:Transcript_25072/g.65380  ORF Transcript_25072/g.65380 Transcript_25072/m.65380 type:complete len:180 (+) Transcript_25072:145-684(+)